MFLEYLIDKEINRWMETVHNNRLCNLWFSLNIWHDGSKVCAVGGGCTSQINVHDALAEKLKRLRPLEIPTLRCDDIIRMELKYIGTFTRRLGNQPSAFRIPWLRFSVIFLSCKANDRAYDTKSGHGPHSPHPQARRLHLSACKMSLLRLSQSGLRTQTVNQAKFIPPTIGVVPPRR